MKLYKELDFIPAEKIVITFDKYRTFETEQRVVDHEASEGKDEMITKMVKGDVKFNIQIARIIGIPTNETTYKVGDEVVVDLHHCVDLNGYKDMQLIAKYQILGIKVKDVEPIDDDPIGESK